MGPLLLMAALMGVLGLAIGSFLNVVIYRVPRAESVVTPASHCPRCDTAIKGRHNIPVLSWLMLRGRCAACRLPISARYPLVEAATGLLFGAVTLHFGITPTLPAFLYLAAIGVALAMIDFDVRRLPDSIVMPSYVVAAALLIPVAVRSGDWHAVVRGLVGLAALAGVMFTVSIAFANGGDTSGVKLAGLLGLYLAWLSWDALLVGVVAALVLAGVAGVGGTAVPASGPAGRSLAGPLAPCFLVAAALSVFLAAPVTGWYGALLAA